MKKIFTILATCLLSLSAFAQTSYNDVLVVVNSNSKLSQSVAQYFKAQRNIPNNNICSVAMPLTEEINGTQYSSIINQIKSYLKAKGLTNTIKYIVTTQDVPLKVRRANSVFSLSSDASSFDSDLCLLNSKLESYIGKSGYVANPYYSSTTSFIRSTAFQNIYLVTRLAGYSYNDIVGLIDRACQPYIANGKFVFDQDPTWGTTSSLNTRMQVARDTLVNRGYNVLLNTTSSFVVNQTNVLGYTSWGSNDRNWSSYSQKAQPRFTWSPKALAETYVSSSGRTFSDSTFIEPTIGWQSLIADLIHENGVTGAKGYVYEPYTTAMARVHILFDCWTKGYNLAESFYAASACIGWMDVVIGDPKSQFAVNGQIGGQVIAGNRDLKNIDQDLHLESSTTIPKGSSVIENEFMRKITSNIGDQKQDFALCQNYPNPFNPATTISYYLPEECNVTLTIFTLSGQEIANILLNQIQPAGTQTVHWNGVFNDGSSASSGTYLYRLSATKNGEFRYTASKRMILLR